MKKKGFTLVEIISVMVIIMTLAGMVLVVSKGALNKAKKSKAEAMISALSVAISMYDADCGRYPNAQNFTKKDEDDVSLITLANENLRFALIETSSMILPANEGTNWKGPYIEFKAKDLAETGGTGYSEIVDPWGHPYAYLSTRNNPGGSFLHNTNSFDLWSAGLDGVYGINPVTGVTDDITNW